MFVAILGGVFLGCETMEATTKASPGVVSTPPATVPSGDEQDDGDSSPPPKKPKKPATEPAQDDENDGVVVVVQDTPTDEEAPTEDLSVEAAWTEEELAELAIGAKGFFRTVLQGFELTDLPVTLAGVANIVSDSNTPFQLFHGAAGADGKNSLAKWGGAAAGMSGSPIVMDGRVVSALSYGLSWPEIAEPFQFGATPAWLMAQLKGNPATGMKALGMMSITGGDRYMKLFEEVMAEKGFEPSLRLATSASVRHFDADEIPEMVPGSAIALPFVMPEDETGTVSMAAIGTVTMMNDEKLWAFGHPLSMSGAVELPYTAAWIDSTFGDSFGAYKLGVAVGPVLGTIVEDRGTAIVGVKGAIPDMIKVVSVVHTPTKTKLFRHLVTDTSKLPFIAPVEYLIGLTTMLPIDQTADQYATEATIVANFTVKVKNTDTVAKFRIVSSTLDPSSEIFWMSMYELFRLTSAWGEVAIDEVESDIWYEQGLHVLELSSLELPKEVKDDEPFELDVKYHVPDEWDEKTESLVVNLPANFAKPGAFLSVQIVTNDSYGWYGYGDPQCLPAPPESLEEWMTKFNNESTSADTVQVVVETQNTDLQDCYNSCGVGVGGGGGQECCGDCCGDGCGCPPPPPPDNKACIDACSEKFKCAPYMRRYTQPWTVTDHVISGQVYGSTTIAPNP